MPTLEEAVKSLQDSLIVVSEIERRQTERLKEHNERIVAIEASFARSTEWHKQMEDLHKDTEEKLNALIRASADSDERLNALIKASAEGDERLNLLIGIVDDIIRKRPPQ